jgi:hypothetical protein
MEQATLTDMVHAESKRYDTFMADMYCLLHLLRVVIKEDTRC